LKPNHRWNKQKRIEALLGGIEGSMMTREMVRGWRSLDALEMIGTPEARPPSKGAPGARLTKGAGESLERMARRPAVP